MTQITLKPIRQQTTVTLLATLTDNGVKIDWSDLSVVKAYIYSESQRVVAGPCTVQVDGEDPTILRCVYDASKPQYLGTQKLVIYCEYEGQKNTYDKAAFTFVASTAATVDDGTTVGEDTTDVDITVEDVSSSILAGAIKAALDAAEFANETAESVQERADQDHTRAEEDHSTAASDHTTAAADHTTAAADHTQAAADHNLAAADHVQAGLDHTQASADHGVAVSDHGQAGQDHTRAESDHSTAASDHTKAGQDHTRAESDHTQAAADHTLAGTDHSTAAADHTQAASDHTAAAADHTLAASDHSTAAADHTQALADHQVMQGYDTRLTNVEGEVSQLGQEVDGLCEQLDYTQIVPTFSRVENQAIRGNTGNPQDNNNFAYAIIPLGDYKRVRFLGIKTSETVAWAVGYALGYYLNESWTPISSSAFDYDENAPLAGTLKEYVIDNIPAGATHIAVTCRTYYDNVAILNDNNFYIYLESGIKVPFSTGENVLKCALTEDIRNNLSTKIIPNTKAFYKTIQNNQLSFVQSTRFSGNEVFPLRPGIEYVVTVILRGFSSVNYPRYTGLRLYARDNTSDLVKSVTQADFVQTPIEGGIKYTAIVTVDRETKKLNNGFNSAFADESGSPTVEITSTYAQPVFMPYTEWNKNIAPLTGKKVVMFGDSITQLPKTGTVVDGDGIVEYFAEYSGAEVVRAAFGGTHLTTRRIISSIADIVDKTSVIAAFDQVNIIHAFVNNDFSIQEAAWTFSEEQLPAGDKVDSYWRTILDDLEAVNLGDVDFVTILSGVNDYSASVPLGDSTTSLNIQTIYGAWEQILTELATANINVFVLTPLPKRGTLNDPTTYCELVPNSGGIYLRQYVQANLEAAMRYNYPACDLFHTIGFNNVNFVNFYKDGTHPTKGFNHIARRIASFIMANFNR